MTFSVSQLRAALILCLLLVATLSAPAVFAEARTALVVGVSDYRSVSKLANPGRDAKAVSSALRERGFNVTQLIDPDSATLSSAIKQLKSDLQRKSGVGLLFYAGHGIQSDGRNYLIPTDGALPSRLSRASDGGLIELSAATDALSAGDLGIVILDACRDDPYLGREESSAERAISRNRKEERADPPQQSLLQGGFAKPELDTPSRTLIAFATAPGKTAMDGIPGRSGGNSPYTTALTEILPKPGLSLHDLFNEVGLRVDRMTNGRQTPWISASPVPRLCLAGGCAEEQPLSEVEATLRHCTRQGRLLNCSIDLRNNGSRSLRVEIPRPYAWDDLGGRYPASYIRLDRRTHRGMQKSWNDVLRAGRTTRLLIHFSGVSSEISSLDLLDLQITTGDRRLVQPFQQVGVQRR